MPFQWSLRHSNGSFPDFKSSFYSPRHTHTFDSINMDARRVLCFEFKIVVLNDDAKWMQSNLSTIKIRWQNIAGVLFHTGETLIVVEASTF